MHIKIYEGKVRNLYQHSDLDKLYIETSDRLRINIYAIYKIKVNY